MRRKYFWVFPVLIVIFLSINFSCSKKDEIRLHDLEKTENIKGKTSKERIKELEKGIERYTEEVNRTVKASAEIGIYYRMLGLEYIRLKMYDKALESLKKAISYYPENPVLFYYSGICSGQMAKSEINKKIQLDMFKKAAAYYRRAVALNDSYTDAQYALAVLYVFELNRPFDALGVLEKIVKRNPENTEAGFLLARTDFMMGKVRDAIDRYNQIIKISGNEAARNKARTLRDTLLSEVGNE